MKCCWSPDPCRMAELSHAFCDTIQAPEVGQQALDDDDAWLASYSAYDLLRMDSGWFICESLAFSAAMHHKNVRFRDFVCTHGKFARTPANIVAAGHVDHFFMKDQMPATSYLEDVYISSS